MRQTLQVAQLTGRDDSHLVTLPDGHRLQEPAAEALGELQRDAARSGFELAIASSFRSYERQLAIWNDKVLGERPLHDEHGQALDLERLSTQELLQAILRYSAIPGTSRHHWGTDLDVYDAAAVPADYRVELTPQEVAPGGVFDPLHRWLDERMAADASHGFYRPYALDRGGVAPERWHLSYSPLALLCEGVCNADALRECWDAGEPLMLREVLEADLPAILARFVAVPQDWCMRH